MSTIERAPRVTAQCGVTFGSDRRRRPALAFAAVVLALAGAPDARAGAPSVVAVTHGHPAAISGAAWGQHEGPLAVSQDGRYVAFVSGSRNLIAGYQPGDAFYFPRREVYLFDRVTSAMTLVSHKAGFPSKGGSGASFAPTLSDDGRYVAFLSYGGDLVAGQVDDPFATLDAFVFDR